MEQAASHRHFASHPGLEPFNEADAVLSERLFGSCTQPGSIGKEYQRATLVFVADVVSMRPPAGPSRSGITTRITFKVLERLKGAVPDNLELDLEPSSEEFNYRLRQRVLVYVVQWGPLWSSACTRTRALSSSDAAFSESEVRALRALRDGPALVSLQIPEQAEWEITFAQVEAAAGLPDLRTAPPDTFEARVMLRAVQALGPVPFLRIVRSGGTVHARLLVFWGRNVSPSHQPKGDDVRCRDGVCVKPIDLIEQRDWAKVVSNLARQSACPGKSAPRTVRTPDGGVSTVVAVCPHCPQVYIKTVVEGRYREQVCDDPLPQTETGGLRALMLESARARGR